MRKETKNGTKKHVIYKFVVVVSFDIPLPSQKVVSSIFSCFQVCRNKRGSWVLEKQLDDFVCLPEVLVYKRGLHKRPTKISEFRIRLNNVQTFIDKIK